jgi:hypothetical protein
MGGGIACTIDQGAVADYLSILTVIPHQNLLLRNRMMSPLDSGYSSMDSHTMSTTVDQKLA